MPEGHTIHRLASDLNRSLQKDKVRASSPQGRFSDGAARLDKTVCTGFEAHGKHLLGHFGGGDVLHVHLGLIGKFQKEKGEPRGAVRLRLSVDNVNWDLRGPMVCRVGTPDLADDVAASVGPDPLHPSGSFDTFATNMAGRRIAVGAAILDQKVIAGIGNVYRSELLFVTGIDPRTRANQIDESRLRTLWDVTVEQLRRGKRLNRIVMTNPAELGYKSDGAIPEGERLYAYKRQDQPCRLCATSIEQLEVAGRKMWMCPTCQKP